MRLLPGQIGVKQVVCVIRKGKKPLGFNLDKGETHELEEGAPPRSAHINSYICAVWDDGNN